MFIKDSFTCYYTQPVCDLLNNQWTDTKIKVVLDLITFLLDNDDAANNVRSLETIINGIDENTKTIISEIF
jgi:methionine salvage enolase-phosphatase E1